MIVQCLAISNSIRFLIKKTNPQTQPPVMHGFGKVSWESPIAFIASDSRTIQDTDSVSQTHNLKSTNKNSDFKLPRKASGSYQGSISEIDHPRKLLPTLLFFFLMCANKVKEKEMQLTTPLSMFIHGRGFGVFGASSAAQLPATSLGSWACPSLSTQISGQQSCLWGKFSVGFLDLLCGQ